MEMMALACSLTTIQSMDFHNVSAAADCLSAVNMSKKALHGHTKLTKCFQLVSALHSSKNILIRHVKAHPERRIPDSRDWSADDWGIYKADALAGIDTGNTLEDEWLLQDLTSMMEFRIVRTKDHSIYFQDIDRHISNTAIDKYIQDRNNSRNSRLGTNDKRWSNEYLPLISILHSNTSSTTAWATTLRLVWDKSWHGANQAKAAVTTIDTDRCRHCLGFEDQEHIILRCPFGLETRQKLAETFLDAYKGNKRVDTMAKLYLSQAQQNHTLWTGTPNAEARQFLGMTLGGLQLSESEWSNWKKALRLIGETARKLQIEHLRPPNKNHYPGAPTPPSAHKHQKKLKFTLHRSSYSLNPSRKPQPPSRRPKKGIG